MNDDWYEECRRLAVEKAKRQAELMYPPEEEELRKAIEARLTNHYYKQLVSE